MQSNFFFLPLSSSSGTEFCHCPIITHCSINILIHCLFYPPLLPLLLVWVCIWYFLVSVPRFVYCVMVFGTVEELPLLLFQEHCGGGGRSGSGCCESTVQHYQKGPVVPLRRPPPLPLVCTVPARRHTHRHPLSLGLWHWSPADDSHRVFLLYTLFKSRRKLLHSLSNTTRIDSGYPCILSPLAEN